MSIFRTQEHVPDVYVRKSRDFQLLCNVFDVVNSSVKYNIDSMRNIVDSDYCNSNLLDYLQHKVGFYTDVKLTDSQQRTIIKGFPYLLHNKGSCKGIEQALYLYLKTQNINTEITISTQNVKNSTNTITTQNKTYTAPYLSNVYLVSLGVKSTLLDTDILSALLRYIIPTGYFVEYKFFDNTEYTDDSYISADTLRIVFVTRNDNDSFISGNKTIDNTDEQFITNAVATTTFGSQGNSQQSNVQSATFTHEGG